MSTQPAAPMNGKMTDLRLIDSGLKRARFADKTATFFFYLISAAFVFLLIAFTLYVVWGGVKAMKPEIFSFGPTGIGSQFFNTVYLVVLSLLISVPIGVMAGVYMAEYASPGRVTHMLRIAIETLSSLPSIVVGLFGYLVFIIMVHSQWNLFSGALAVSVLSLPLITSTTYDAFQLVVGARDGQGVDLLVAHDLPCLAQTGGAGDAGHLAVVHITDLRVDIGTHPGRRDAEPLEHEFRLLVHPSGPAGLADKGACLIFQLCVRNGRADRVGVRVAMPDDHDFMSSLWHRFLPPYGSWVVLLIMIPERRFVRVPARRRKGKPSGNFHCNTRWNGGKVAQRSRSLKILRDSCIHLLAFWGKTLYHRDKSVYFEKAPSGAARRSE